MLSYNILLERLNFVCLNTGYQFILTPETTQDIMCHWRTYKLCKIGASCKIGINIFMTLDYCGLEDSDLLFKIVNPLILSYKNKYEKQQMTREEALKKCFNTMEGQPIRSSDINVKQLIAMLEALGLIKFEEENKDLTEAIHKARMDSCAADQSDFLKNLRSYGYKIVKIDA